MESTRLNKFISHNSIYSRREADKLIQEKQVTLNGEVVENMATQVSEEDLVKVKGKVVKDKSEEMYTVIVYNKAKGELVTKSDPRGRKTIFDNLAHKYKHFMPVGRLDYASEGVLILSDSVDVVNSLMHSSLERVYKIKVNGMIGDDVINAMQTGLQLEDASKGGHEASDIQEMNFAPFISYQIISQGHNFSKIKVIITEGKNRELRRFFANFDLDVVDLKRLDYGGITLNNLPTGKSRYLTREEYTNLRRYMKDLEKLNDN
ncbi:MAG: pseudouridine synthase [Campylobacterota bacterium]|nr:pseudouridine synthase [Campylobacterota bacterium]